MIRRLSISVLVLSSMIASARRGARNSANFMIPIVADDQASGGNGHGMSFDR